MEKKRIARAIRRTLGGATGTRRARWSYAIAAVASVPVFLVFWCTNAFGDAILANLELRNGSASFDMWKRPPVGLLVKVHVFNYTNVREFENGNATKLRLQEVGPYVYRETLSRVNVVTHANRTVTYQEKKSFRWIGGRPETDTVTVPNMLLASAMAYSRNSRYSYITQLGMTAVLSFLRAESYIRLPIGRYLWGYEDPLFRAAKGLRLLDHPTSDGKLGILASANGSHADRITIHTGIGDLRKLGVIERINGQAYRGVWADAECDRIYGTDGSMFPPAWLGGANSSVHVYAAEICRRLSFRYEGRGFCAGIPTFRYKLPSNAFASGSPDAGSCSCPNRGECPPTGTFNVSACKYGTPLVVSFPHFYSADESLFRKIDGLKPDQDRHESYVDLHPRLGITMAAGLRFQLNAEVHKASGLPFYGNLEDGTILPLIWIDSQIDRLPDSIRRIFYHAHYLVNAVEAAFQWCSLIAAVLSVAGFLSNLRGADDDDDDEDDDELANSRTDASERNGDAALAPIESDRSRET